MSELLHKARSICVHLRHSHPAAARLAALQRDFGLPTHRMICNITTRWNSTFHMLERLCEQQQAIVEFQLRRARTSRSSQQPHFTTTEWASMRDICAVLRCFDDSTNMASADDAIISLTIPLLCLLEKTLQGMRNELKEPEDEKDGEHGAMTQFSGPSSAQGSQGGIPSRQRAGNTQMSIQGTFLEEEDEKEGRVRTEQGGNQSSTRASLEHGCGDTEEPDNTPPTEDSGSLPMGSLAHV